MSQYTKYRIINDAEILDQRVRAKIIKEIAGTENAARKQEAQKRQEIYKDNTKKWVIEALSQEGLLPQTLAQMANRASNISICKKIIDKLARCYLGGVSRVASVEGEQQQVDDLAKLLKLNAKNKKADRFRELHRNTMVQVIPVKDLDASEESGSDKFSIEYRVFSPWHYDVIEDYYDHEKPRVVILSDFSAKVHASQFTSSTSDGPMGAHTQNSILGSTRADGDGQNQLIADSPYDEKSCEFIFWSKKYHFTCDKEGGIIRQKSPEDLLNPVEKLPFVNIAQDQDGEFWAEGGDDLIDGAVLVNLVVTDILSIAFVQGYGQLVVTGGSDIPDQIQGGPFHAIVLRRRDAQDPEPKADYIQANPPLEMHMKALEQYVALTLSTNGLSPTNVANALDGAQFPSGISLLIENSEVSGKIEDKQELMAGVESSAFELIKRWQNYLFDKQALTDEFQKIGKLSDDLSISVKFNQSKPVITEKEKLEGLKLKQELGIIDQIDMILADNPEMTREDAEQKLKQITQSKLKNRELLMGAAEKIVGQTNDESQINDAKSVDEEQPAGLAN